MPTSQEDPLISASLSVRLSSLLCKQDHAQLKPPFPESLPLLLLAETRNAREEEELFLRLAPRCPQHQRAGKLLTVRKTGLNKGRKFYACSLPRGAHAWESR